MRASLERLGVLRLLERHLSTSDRLGETLCGLVMVLTFTLVAGPQVDEGRKGVLQLLAATAGCCVTWGLVDGVLYVLDAVSQRARRGRVAVAVRAKPDVATTLLEKELDTFLGELGVEPDRDRLLSALGDAVGRRPVPGLRVTSEDWLGGLSILGVQLLCCVPSLAPFAMLGDPRLALRISNAISIVLLFAVSFQWADDLGASRLKTAVLVALVGGLLVAISVALSG